MAIAPKRVSAHNYYNYIVIPTVILIVCLGVTIPFLVYEEQRLTSKQLIESIRNVLSPSNSHSVLRASAVPDLDTSYLPLLIGLVLCISVSIFLAVKDKPLEGDFTLFTPIILALVIIGYLVLCVSYFTKMDTKMIILGVLGFLFLGTLFASSVYQTDILKKKKDVSGNILP